MQKKTGKAVGNVVKNWENWKIYRKCEGKWENPQEMWMKMGKSMGNAKKTWKAMGNADENKEIYRKWKENLEIYGKWKSGKAVRNADKNRENGKCEGKWKIHRKCG